MTGRSGLSGSWVKLAVNVEMAPQVGRAHSPQPINGVCPSWALLGVSIWPGFLCGYPLGEDVLLSPLQPWQSWCPLSMSQMVFWLQTAGWMLNESAGPHKLGASACNGCLLPGLSMGLWSGSDSEHGFPSWACQVPAVGP